jgi:hypothetical protein
MIVRKLLLAAVVAVLVASVPILAYAYQGDATDPARNLALPCEHVSTTGLVSRSSRAISHVANVCGFVGTDVELQSRTDTAGRTHDYAFVGTMGAGMRIFDVTDPAHPTPAGGYADPGWENDVQVRGDIAAATYDGVDGEDSSGSTCLKTRYPDSSGQGVDIYRLDYNELTAAFETNLLTCVANPPGGAHNASLHPSGSWLAISNCCSDWAIDVVDLRNAATGAAVHRYRLIDESKAADTSRCPAAAAFTCVTMRRPNGSSAAGLWRPHDVFFSRDGNTAYVAAINSTWILDVSKVLAGKVRPIAVIPNETAPGGLNNPENVSISHQADTTSDGKILVVSDERGGGLTETGCNTDPAGVIGGLHFFALAPLNGVAASAGASPSSPKKLGDYFTPQPLMAPDPLGPAISALPRTERGCTIHVFRLGGNGSTSPGAIVPGLDGVSRLPGRELTSAHYGAGVWHLDISHASSSTDGVVEDARSTWGNTLGWDVMPGADTWSAKEYKGYVYSGDILRGFDIYHLGG